MVEVNPQGAEVTERTGMTTMRIDADDRIVSKRVRPRATRVGVVFATQHDGIAEPVHSTLRALGMFSKKLVLGEPWGSLDDIDEIVVAGPMFPLEALFHQLPSTVDDWPPIAVWLTEQTPSPTHPFRGWLLTTASKLALRLGRARGSTTGDIVPLRGSGVWWGRGQRYRLCGCLSWLHGRSKLSMLAVLTPSHAEYFARRVGIPASYVPYGYHNSFGRPLDRDRDIDVVFLGSLRDRRRSRIVSGLASDLALRGVSLRIHDGGRHGPLVFGEDRTELLNRSRIMLSIMRQPWDDTVFRMLLAAPNGAMVVSEPTLDKEPFESGVHFESAELHDLADSIGAWLADERVLKERTEAARHKVMNELRIESMCERFMSGSVAVVT